MKYYLFMMKFLKFVLIFLFMLALPVYAENLGIKDIAFDKSDNLIFMATDNYTTVPTVKKGVLTNPDRVYWDIENAVLKRGQATYNFENGKLSKFKISQFSTNPAKVRIVLTFAQKTDASAVKMISPGGGSLIIELGKPVSKQNFLVPIYRETKISSYD
ncbi:MAG: AMIN domain-containing protein [Candidatus Gastranaerophilaceae bacterium]